MQAGRIDENSLVAISVSRLIHWPRRCFNCLFLSDGENML